MSCHVTDDIIRLLTEARVRVITFAPHTTQIFQVLDVTLFGVLKWRLGYEMPFEDEKETVTFRMKGYHDFKQTMVEPNIWEAFRAIGFEFDTEADSYQLLSRPAIWCTPVPISRREFPWARNSVDQRNGRWRGIGHFCGCCRARKSPKKDSHDVITGRRTS
jgi:hypothetical protein